MTTNSSSKGIPVKPSYDDDNIFARILRGELPSQKIYENEVTLAFYDINPQAPVHILIIPKGRYISFSDFSSTASSNEIAGFIRAIGNVARKLGVEETGYRLLANTGLDSHQEIPHFHIHLFAGKPLGPMLSR